MYALRNCWSALENKAEQKIQALRSQGLKAQEMLENLQSSHARLVFLYEEYRAQSAAALELKGMQDALNQRQFMSQLQTLRDRVDSDLQQTQKQIDVVAQSIQMTEIERLKMKTLRENDLAEHNRLLARAEQRRMDEVGVLQFNHSNRS